MGKKAAEITIRNLTGKRIPPSRSIREAARKVLELEHGAKRGAVSVTYVDDARMKKLNLRFMKRRSSTDVLAFGMKEGARLKGEDGILGDIIICVDTAARQAARFRSTKTKELKLYLIHGILHLLGYDDRTAQGFKNMAKRQEELLKII